MTATPIPRTLSLTCTATWTRRALRELPKGRRPVKTWVVPEDKRDGAYEFIRERLREGRQCYVVCPLVEESEAARRRGRRRARPSAWRPSEFADFRVGGACTARCRRAPEARGDGGFASRRELDVLVATSVIEVGVDVANATVMVIEEADRYGLSQLHQLRGRVGRGRATSPTACCSRIRTARLAHQRLKALAEERDGFRLAEIDLTLSGEGDLLGTKQSGLPEFRVARLPEDRYFAAARSDGRGVPRACPWQPEPDSRRALDHARYPEQLAGASARSVPCRHCRSGGGHHRRP